MVDWDKAQSVVIQDAIVMDVKSEVIQPSKDAKNKIETDAIEIGCN